MMAAYALLFTTHESSIMDQAILEGMKSGL